MAALASTSLAAAGTALPASGRPAEDPRLVVIGERIGPLLTAYRAAVTRRAEARAAAERLCPPLPVPMIRRRDDDRSLRRCADDAVDIEGQAIFPEDDSMPPLRVYWPGAVRRAVEAGDLPTASARSVLGQRVRAVLAAGDDYDARRSAAIEAAGLLAAREEQYRAAQEIDQIAREVCRLVPSTTAGAVVVARVATALAEVEREIAREGYAFAMLGSVLADTLIRGYASVPAMEKAHG